MEPTSHKDSCPFGRTLGEVDLLAKGQICLYDQMDKNCIVFLLRFDVELFKGNGIS